MKKEHYPMKNEALVRKVNPNAMPIPSVAITITVDTSYIISILQSQSSGSGTVSTGIYMFDNQLNNGSTGEGTLELSSCVNAGQIIGFEVVPIDLNTGDTVAITGFEVSNGNVFGSQGAPIQEKPNYWLAQAVNAGQQTYQIQIKVTSGGLRPTDYYAHWDPFIKAQ